MKSSLSHQLVNILRDKFTSQFAEYYDGDPIGIPERALPCLVVDKVSTDITSGPTQMDRVEHKLTIIVVMNKQNDFGKNASEAVTMKKLEEITEGQADGGGYDTSTVMGILRRNFTLDEYAVNQDVTIDYGVSVRGATQLVTAESRVTFTVTQLVPVTRH